jgi:ribosome modulation factor
MQFTNESIYYNEGYEASYISAHPNLCPYAPTAEEVWKRMEWERGWKDGDADAYDEATDE